MISATGIFRRPFAFALPFLIVVASCEAVDQSRYPDVAKCMSLVSLIEKNMRDDELVRQTFGDKTVNERIDYLERTCPPASRRDLAVANLMAAGGLAAESLAYLEQRRFPEPQWERDRLVALYWSYMEMRKREGMLRVAEELHTNHPGSAEDHTTQGVERCMTGQCDQAVEDLEIALEQTNDLNTGRYLMVAYMAANRYGDALQILDSEFFEVGGLNSHMLFAAVTVYLSAGRRSDAVAVFDQFMAEHPGIVLEADGPNYLAAKTKALIDQN